MSRKPLEFQAHPWGFERARELGLCRAFAEYTVDGDTWDLFIDLGFGQYCYVPIRLVSDDPAVYLDVAELSTELGKAAREFCQAEIQGKPLLIKSYREQQTFDRWLGQVWICHGPTTMSPVRELLAPFLKKNTP